VGKRKSLESNIKKSSECAVDTKKRKAREKETRPYLLKIATEGYYA
jgi:hypothetical protein